MSNSIIAAATAAISDDDKDLTEQLYNDDGSLKDNSNSEVLYNTISIDFQQQEEEEGKTKITKGMYKIPSKWNKEASCKSINIFTSPIQVNNIQKASTSKVGIAKALQ